MEKNIETDNVEKKKIVITTDSGCFRNPIVQNKTEVFVIPACVNDSKGNIYMDGVDITNREIYERMQEGELFKTSSPAMQDYFDTYLKALHAGESVIHVSMSSGISSGSFNSACFTASEINNQYSSERIHVVDSKQGTTGGELVIRKIIELIEQDMNVLDIVDYIERFYIPFIRTTFLVPDASGFIRSGRDSSSLSQKERMKLFALKSAQMLNLKFQVDFVDGYLKQNGQFRANHQKSWLQFLKRILFEQNKLNDIDSSLLVYGTTQSDEIWLEQGHQYIKDLGYFKQISKHNIGSVVAAYTTPNLCGVSYVLKKK